MQNRIIIKKKIGNYNKKIIIPGDKSLSIRWVLISSLANGISKAKNLLMSEDVIATINAIRKLGVRVKINNTISGMSISDFFVINQWLNYAKEIGDQSYKQIGFETFNSQYISEKMLNQVEFRRKEFMY